MPEHTNKSPINTSINIDHDLADWIKSEQKRRKVTRSKLINLVIRERLNQRPVGFIHDIRWLLEEKHGPFNIVESKHNKDWFAGAFEVLDPRNIAGPAEDGELVCKILVAENTRDDLMRLFAESVVEQSSALCPVILLIPYKLDKTHRVWSALDKQVLIHVVTPDGLIKTIHDLARS